jgi:ribulose-5-phosphate 4-epimerase/fuculose-1-phosphate aldolase
MEQALSQSFEANSGNRRKKVELLGEMVVGRAVTDASAARNFAEREGPVLLLGHQFQRCLDQRAAEIAMMIGLGFLAVNFRRHSGTTDVDGGYISMYPMSTSTPRRKQMTHEASPASVRDRVTPEEWEQRIALAAAYRLVAHFHWDDLIFTHLSARVPGPEHHFLINPYGMTFDEITASSLVKVDLNGTKVMDSPYQINPAGFTIHSAIHAAREDAKCALHVHSINGAAVSAQRDGLLPVSQQSMFVLSSLAYHDYEGVALRDDEKLRLVRDLGDKNFFMLRNHGLITVANNIPDAFLFMYTFESACMIQVRAQAGGGELVFVDPFIIETARQQAVTVTKSEIGALAWPALLRKLDRIDPSYRH